ncbi:MAG TPA: helix-turn-helix domain-containing protein [Candidatus Sulfotelmatobacter sp.]|jgi:hypothetical protein|nr:helix-turn-helix domain-containing protein [Candidatus Sulfotelmatobacter sp.]
MSAEQQQPEWLDLKSLRQYACVSERTIRGRIRRPENSLPAVQVGKRILVRRSTFDHWLEYVLPDSAVWLVPELKQNREDLIGLLKNVGTPPQMPPGVRLLKWEPQTPPVVIVRMGIVNNSTSSLVPLFELRARLEGKHFLAETGR